jgi:hypothetical protein
MAVPKVALGGFHASLFTISTGLVDSAYPGHYPDTVYRSFDAVSH